MTPSPDDYSMPMYERQADQQRGRIINGGCTSCGAHEGSEACWDGDAYRWGCPMLTDEEMAHARLVPYD